MNCALPIYSMKEHFASAWNDELYHQNAQNAPSDGEA